MKFYIAFSIHGTNTFIVATKTADSVEALGRGFRVVNSRRGDVKLEEGTKVEWTRLTNCEGKPLASAPYVLLRYNELAKDGWNIVEETRKAFINHHWKKGK